MGFEEIFIEILNYIMYSFISVQSELAEELFGMLRTIQGLNQALEVGRGLDFGLKLRVGYIAWLPGL